MMMMITVKLEEGAERMAEGIMGLSLDGGVGEGTGMKAEGTAESLMK